VLWFATETDSELSIGIRDAQGLIEYAMGELS